MTPLGAAASVLQSCEVVTPVTAGIVFQSIILPPAWTTWPEETVRAVLAHESAHVKRRDAIIAFIAHINRAVFWFHPLAWWLERTLAITAEHACDETAAAVIGEPRRYAEILVGMAEAVRANGGRVVWQGVGVNGAGLLGTRIDRLLSGEVVRTSRARKLVATISCVVAIFAVAACRQQITATPLKEDPELAKSLAKQNEQTKRFLAARDMTTEQADALEGRVAKNPEDFDAREQLVTYYRMGRAVPWDKKVPGLRRHALWLIEHHPAHEIAPPPLSPVYDPEGFATARKLWEFHLSKPNASPFLISRAAYFFQPHDKPTAEQLLLRGLALDPNSEALNRHFEGRVAGYQWPARLGFLYGEALIGSVDGSTRSFDAERARSPFAMEVRRKLAASNDATMLVSVGRYLLDASFRPDANAELKALGKRYLERALTLQPDLETARTSLFLMGVRDRVADLRGTP